MRIRLIPLASCKTPDSFSLLLFLSSTSDSASFSPPIILALMGALPSAVTAATRGSGSSRRTQSLSPWPSSRLMMFLRSSCHRHGACLRLLPPVGVLFGVCHGLLFVCRFSGESLVCAGDDGTVGVIFLLESITVRTSI